MLCMVKRGKNKVFYFYYDLIKHIAFYHAFPFIQSFKIQLFNILKSQRLCEGIGYNVGAHAQRLLPDWIRVVVYFLVFPAVA